MHLNKTIAYIAERERDLRFSLHICHNFAISFNFDKSANEFLLLLKIIIITIVNKIFKKESLYFFDMFIIGINLFFSGETL